MSIREKLEQIVGANNVLTSKAELYAYALDATNKDKFNLPDAVVFVENITQVQQIVKYAYENIIPIVPRGAGTGLCGGCTCCSGGIVLSFSKMNKILEINKTNLTATVQMGVVLADLKKETEKIDLFFPPDPANLAVSTIGGSIALSSGGSKSFKYGTTKDYILNLKVVLQDGTLINTGANTTKNATGYNLTQLFTGSEGTLGIIVEAVLKLIPKPEKTALILVYFDSMQDAVSMVDKILTNHLYPASLDFLDRKTLQTIENFAPAGLLDREAALFIETDGHDIDYDVEKIVQLCKQYGGKDIQTAKNKQDCDKIWTARRSSFAACAKLKPNVVADDVVVPREKIADLVKGIKEICNKNNLIVCIMGHIGDGNIHPNIPLDLNNPQDVENYKKAKLEMHQLAVKLGGTLSGEHGIGFEKKDYMQFALDKNVLKYMKKIKNIFDEKNIFNPHKVID